MVLFKSVSSANRIPPPSPFVGLRYAPASSRTGRGDDPQHLVAQKCPALLTTESVLLCSPRDSPNRSFTALAEAVGRGLDLWDRPRTEAASADTTGERSSTDWHSRLFRHRPAAPSKSRLEFRAFDSILWQRAQGPMRRKAARSGAIRGTANSQIDANKPSHVAIL